MSRKITPFLWFVGNAEEAANTYVRLFPNSRITGVERYPENVPGGTPGEVMTISFELDGELFTGLNGPAGVFEQSGVVSFVIHCKDQAEIDHYWDGLLEGGQAQQCGWLVDRFGITWQVVPDRMLELMTDPDRDAAQRVTDAMLEMVKIDLAAIEKAYAG